MKTVFKSIFRKKYFQKHVLKRVSSREKFIMKNIISKNHISTFRFSVLNLFLFPFSMSGEPIIPEGVQIPGWVRRCLEARAIAAGLADVPPPLTAAAPPPPPPRVDAFSKICKDFRAMGRKPLYGTDTFVEARN